MLPPKRIALSGGGIKGISHIGALEALHERGLLRCVKEYVGTSAGALIAFAICIGYTLSELHTICVALDFRLTQNIEPDNVFKCLETFGFDDGANTDKFLLVLLKTKGISASLTFEEMQRLLPNAPKLRVYSVNLNTFMIHEFSVEKTPRTEVRWAVRASMAIPLYYTPMKDLSSNEFYVDGCLIAHFPFHHLNDSERLETLGVTFARNPKKIDTMNLEIYLSKLYYSVYYHQNMDLYKRWKHRIIEVDCGNIPSLHFGADSDDKIGLIEAGRKSTEEFIYKCKWLSGAAPVRRYSLP
uniref:PNPLA domain-containing protein n=1 Tax=viral metagenome TaxID=1070528 RepID=A0A6C0JUS2_9ZZZZ